MAISHHRLRFGRWLTAGTILGLAAGVTLGALLFPTENPVLLTVGALLDPIGEAWIRALRMIVVPLVVSLLFVSIVGGLGQEGVERMGIVALAAFLALYGVTTAASALLVPPMIGFLGLGAGALGDLSAEVPALAREAAGTGGGTLSEWVVALFPANPIQAMAEEDFLALVVFTVLFAIAAGRIAPGKRERLTSFFEAIVEAMLVLVVLLIKATPIAVFVLSLRYSREIGFDAGAVLLKYATIESAILFTVAIGLYPVSVFLGRVPLASFARAAWPGQVVGLSTRSSLAAVPALIEGARERLRLPDRVIGFGLPFSASTFKLSRMVTFPTQLLVLAHLYGIEIGVQEFLTFMVTILLLSFAALGIPRTGTGFRSLPAFVAAGIPVEGYVLLRTVEVLPDFFATLVNATSYLTVTTLLPRGAKVPAPVPAPATVGASEAVA